MRPTESLMYLHVNPALKERVVAEMLEGETMGDTVTRLLCKALRLDPADYPIVRRPAGRKPGSKNRKKRKLAD